MTDIERVRDVLARHAEIRQRAKDALESGESMFAALNLGFQTEARKHDEPYRALLLAFLEEHTKLNVALYQQAHLDGCQWLADKRMPCQCGAHQRVDEAMIALQNSEHQARTALASFLEACK